jgi:hypothetical protein
MRRVVRADPKASSAASPAEGGPALQLRPVKEVAMDEQHEELVTQDKPKPKEATKTVSEVLAAARERGRNNVPSEGLMNDPETIVVEELKGRPPYHWLPGSSQATVDDLLGMRAEAARWAAVKAAKGMGDAERENRVRRAAKRQGFKLVRGRTGYELVGRGLKVNKDDRMGLGLDDVEAFLASLK